MTNNTIAVICPRRLVKVLKSALESQDQLSKDLKISPFNDLGGVDGYMYIAENDLYKDLGRCIIPTKVQLGDSEHLSSESLKVMKNKILRQLDIEQYASDIYLAIRTSDSSAKEVTGQSEVISNKGQLAKIVQQWLLTLPSELRANLPVSISHLVSLCSWTYTIYPPLLLLPPNAFTPSPWPTLLRTSLAPHLSALYQLIGSNLHVSHIAINAPIPSHSSASRSNSNILRSPYSLTPLHGSFGPLLASSHPPTQYDYAVAFWCSTRQHGIYQTWAPLYTMFSRGNISEKQRILNMPELKKEKLGRAPKECSAVDLYAGIGYFAFCYLKAGVRKVLCWEVNGWSVEGLRRGAEVNGWGVRTVMNHKKQEEDFRLGELEESGEERLLVFQEDNRRAGWRIEQMRKHISPIRHVNCGFLPSSQDSWETAIKALDPVAGGWVHAHENIAIKDIEDRKSEIVNIFNKVVQGSGMMPQREVECQHLERVKTYAPGVIHCVLDIYIAPCLTPTMPVPTS
ncbi:hypothetical protein MMC24_000009 [Lignoscripta atroalba]|nr:hypothetical protein [Lignoscripta atroalba]